MHKRVPKWVAVDWLAALVLMLAGLVALATFTPNKPPSIETLGYYAIVATWQGNDDADLYVMDPGGHVCYFANLSTGQMHLEHDIIPDYTEVGISGLRQERVVIRGVQIGEYIANVQMYRKVDTKPTRVRVTLYRLKGPDKTVVVTTVVLAASGNEGTAFRFTLDARGNITGISHLQRQLTSLVT